MGLVAGQRIRMVRKINTIRLPEIGLGLSK